MGVENFRVTGTSGTDLQIPISGRQEAFVLGLHGIKMDNAGTIKATAEGGDVVDFWARAKDIPVQTAVDQLGAMIGVATPPSAKYMAAEEKTVDWPVDLRPPTIEECESLGMLRELPAGAFDLAGRLGIPESREHKGEAALVPDRCQPERR